MGEVSDILLPVMGFQIYSSSSTVSEPIINGDIYIPPHLQPYSLPNPFRQVSHTITQKDDLTSIVNFN